MYDEANDSIAKRLVTYVPGLYKIFDEIIVNAADNKQRDPNMSKLKVCMCAPWHPCRRLVLFVCVFWSPGGVMICSGQVQSCAGLVKRHAVGPVWRGLKHVFGLHGPFYGALMASDRTT